MMLYFYIVLYYIDCSTRAYIEGFIRVLERLRNKVVGWFRSGLGSGAFLTSQHLMFGLGGLGSWGVLSVRLKGCKRRTLRVSTPRLLDSAP